MITPIQIQDRDSGYRVVSAGAIGVTADDPFQKKKEPFAQPMSLNGLEGIFGTGGIKAAGRRQKRRDNLLIAPYS
jgi:hypothetical protein